MEYDFHAVHTLREGLAFLGERAVDVVFLDVRLPDGNGLDAIPRIRASEGGPEVIILTGLGDPDGAELAIAAGVWDYLVKPFSVKQTRLSLDRALRYRMEAAGPEAGPPGSFRCGGRKFGHESLLYPAGPGGAQ
jgi:two-component system NtrC family response regulator